MNIALDFDKTYDRDPSMWDNLIPKMQEAGHNIFVVTIRSKDLDPHPLLTQLDGDGIKIYFVDGLPKRETMRYGFGINVDIWIDDSPETILFGSRITAPQLEEWRKENVRKLLEEHGPLTPQQS